LIQPEPVAYLPGLFFGKATGLRRTIFFMRWFEMMEQFDFFTENHNVSLRNDVIFAIEQADAATARAALQFLGKNYPQDECLGALQLLIESVAGRSEALFFGHEELHRARLALQMDITPAARQALGERAAPTWLRTRWTQLAQRAALLPFRAEQVQNHAAPLWLLAQQWQAAADAVAKIESWRRIPAPLAWMLQARLALQGLQANWALLAELAWLKPALLAEVIERSPEPLLQQFVSQFLQSYEGAGDASDLSWFVAWVLIERPALSSALTLAQASGDTEPELAMRALIELLGLERQGRQRELVERRKTLLALNASLYATYMAKR